MNYTPYKKGRQFERAIMIDEEGKGNMAFRIAGSKGPFDVIIIKHDTQELWLCQMKRQEGSVKIPETFINLNVPKILAVRKVWITKRSYEPIKYEFF